MPSQFETPQLLATVRHHQDGRGLDRGDLVRQRDLVSPPVLQGVPLPREQGQIALYHASEREGEIRTHVEEVRCDQSLRGSAALPSVGE